MSILANTKVILQRAHEIYSVYMTFSTQLRNFNRLFILPRNKDTFEWSNVTCTQNIMSF